MTVAELIAFLHKLPPGIPVVVYRDDGHLVTLSEAPKVGSCFRYDEPDIVFHGESDAGEKDNGASAPFPAVLIGVTDET